MKLSLQKKLSQTGALSLHVIIPLALALAAIGGIGAYVISRSSAATNTTSGYYISGYYYNDFYCPTEIKRSGYVYYSAIGTWAKYSAAKDSDSIRNIAVKLCAKGKMGKYDAWTSFNTGNYSTKLKDGYASWQRSLGYSGAAADGLPGKTSLQKIGLVPVGY